MTSNLKPLKLYGGGPSPNPAKVLMFLEELTLPYDLVQVGMDKLKEPEFVAVNPNGRVPALEDPNTGITLWESGAIIEYLMETYDKEHNLSFATGTPEWAHAKQWLFFQTTGQGPYYGQAAWFVKYHPEKIQSAVDRYVKEANRVTGVLEAWLAKQKKENVGVDGPWLVGGRISYADISFIAWQRVFILFFGQSGFNEDDYPLVKEWIAKMIGRQGIGKAVKATDAMRH